MKQKLKMIWRILRDRQVVVITESYGRLYCNWDARSLEDVCQMCCETFDKAKEMLLPVAKKFVADRVFVDFEELKRLSDVNLFIEHAFFLNVAEIITA